MDIFNLEDPHFNHTRYEVYAELRHKEPVYWYEPMQSWLVTRHQDIMKLLRSDLVSTDYLIKDKLNNFGNDSDPNVIGITNIIKQWMIYNEPPTHTRLRKFMNMAFDRSHIEKVMPKIRHIVQARAKEVNLANSLDFVKEFAHPVPAIILSSMIGLEDIDINTFITWSDSIANFMQNFVVSPVPDAKIAEHTAVDLIAMKTALKHSIEVRKIEPRDDLLSHLVACLPKTDHMITEDELTLQLIHLIFGGHKIPQFVMSNLIHCLLSRKEVYRKIMSDPTTLLAGAIQESLRFESPIQFITRHAQQEFILHDKQIKPGDSIYLMLGAANRDEDVFEKPDEFNIFRQGNKHLSFGSGIHVCIGAALVKDELNAIFSQFFSEAESIEALYDLGAPEWTNNATFHGIQTLPIQLTAKTCSGSNVAEIMVAQ